MKSRQSELRKVPWLEVSKELVELPDGRMVDDFFVVDMQDFGIVTAFTADNEVVVERLYRHGSKQVTWSLPAGYIDAGELPIEAIKRELREETGYEAEEWTEAGRFIVDGNRGCGWCHCFVATGAHKVQEPSSDDLAEVEVCLVPWPRLVEFLTAGEVAELASAAAIGLASMRIKA